MNVQDNELESAPIVTSSEVNAPDVAMEIEPVKGSEDDSEEGDSEVEDLIDYNEDDDLEAAIKETQAELKELERVALKEMLTANGHALREILRS